MERLIAWWGTVLQRPSPSTGRISTFWLLGTQSHKQPSPQRLWDETNAPNGQVSTLKIPSWMSSVFAEARFNFSLNVAEKDFAASSPPLVQSLRALSPSINGSCRPLPSTHGSSTFQMLFINKKPVIAQYYSEKRTWWLYLLWRRSADTPYGMWRPRCSSLVAEEPRPWWPW